MEELASFLAASERSQALNGPERLSSALVPGEGGPYYTKLAMLLPRLHTLCKLILVSGAIDS